MHKQSKERKRQAEDTCQDGEEGGDRSETGETKAAGADKITRERSERLQSLRCATKETACR